MASLNRLALRNIALVPIRAFTVSSSGKSISSKLHPWFVTGFADAESCFYFKIIKNKNYSTRWVVELNFQIGLHQKDRPLLELIRLFFGVGKITKLGKNYIWYRVSSNKDLAVIIDHLDKYPLITQKRADYELFKEAFNLIFHKEHLTPEGLRKLVAIKGSINRGLSDELKAAFPNTQLVSRPASNLTGILDPNWLAGFVEGEGCFRVCTRKSKTTKLGEYVWLEFTIYQHSRDEQLIQSLVQYLDCGRTRLDPRGSVIYFIVTRLSDIVEKILPFFEKYPLVGVKALNFGDFYKVASVMKAKGHLTKEGLGEIIKIKDGMNTGRFENN